MSNDEIVWATYGGYLVAERENSIGLGQEPGATAECWIPKSELKAIDYLEGGTTEKTDIRIDQAVTGIEVPKWLAIDRGLEIDEG